MHGHCHYVALVYLCYMHEPNICNSNNDPFMSDIESIHIACLAKNNMYDPLLINEKSEGKHNIIEL